MKFEDPEEQYDKFSIEKLGSDCAEKVTQAEAAHNNLQNMKSAESKIASGDIGAALELYNQVPEEFNHDGKNAGTRKQQLNSAIAVAGIVGTYSATGRTLASPRPTSAPAVGPTGTSTMPMASRA